MALEKSPKKSQMQTVDPQSLRSLIPRVTYLKSFLQFTDSDGAAIHASKDVIAPLLPAILDAVYTHLLSYDITAKAFVPRQSGQDPSVPTPNSAAELSLDHPSIRYRQDFLKRYLVKLVSNTDWSDGSAIWEYLDKVGIMHTGEAGFKHREKKPGLRVEYMHMALLLGFVEDLVVNAVMAADLDTATKVAVTRAFNKLLWIQNDLFARHYVVDVDSQTRPNVLGQEGRFSSTSYGPVAATGLVGIVAGAALAMTFWT